MSVGNGIRFLAICLAFILFQRIHASPASETNTSRLRKKNIIIVGAGPAGFVLAYRLSANPNVQVLLLEAGSDPTGVEEIYLPAYAPLAAADPNWTWNYNSTPQVVLGGLTPNLAQGRTLGGGSSVNYLQYGRGARSVYDEWSEISGDPGWSWDEFLASFKGSTQLHLTNETYSPVVDPSAYGHGPLRVTYDKDVDTFAPYFVQAFKDVEGLDEIDVNAGLGIGVMYTTQTLRESNATRHSALAAFGYALAHRPNVKIQHGSWVTKINFKGSQAESVTFVKGQDATILTVCADEIIVSAGAINTPKILMLSGVGPAAHSKSMGIPVVADIPDVGRNNYDHHYAVIEYNVTKNVVGYAEYSKNTTLLRELEAEWRNHANGVLAIPPSSAAAFVRIPDEALRIANATYHLNLPKDRPHIMYQYVTGPNLATTYENANVLSMHIALVQPEAAGSVSLASADYRDAPLLDTNYYGSDGDKFCILWAYKHARTIFKPSGNESVLLNELFPGSNVTSDEDLWKAIAQSSFSYHHPVGTMALQKVLDSKLRIKGLQNIRVVDSSIMPAIPTVWTQGASYAIGERGADIILRDWKM